MWHNSQDSHHQQSPPGPYNHQRHTMSDQMSVSSATTGVPSQLGHPQYQNYNPNLHLVQQPNPNHYHTPTYFYPSSHIHNQPIHANPLSQHPPNPYISSPPVPPLQPPPSL